MPLLPPQSVATLPIRKHQFETPKLRLQLNDLAHEGSSNFLSKVKGHEDIENQVQNVLNLLYTKESHRPGTRSVTFILKNMGGVAFTTGNDLDDDHKEIHISLGYFKDKPRDEMLGVICHELVHCFQWNAEGTCPGGLIEGIADFVRGRAGLAAAHWKPDADGAWDRGYQHTGYFLEYLEDRFGPGTVRKINECLRKGSYDEKYLFHRCCGHTVDELWKDYGEHLKRKKKKHEEAVREQDLNADEDDHER